MAIKLDPSKIVDTGVVNNTPLKLDAAKIVSSSYGTQKYNEYKKQQALQQEFKRMLNPKKSDWERISATKTLQKLQNGEPVSAEKIESAAKTIESQSEGWAALKNPTPLQQNGKDIAEAMRSTIKTVDLDSEQKGIDYLDTKIKNAQKVESRIAALKTEIENLERFPWTVATNSDKINAKKSELKNLEASLKKELGTATINDLKNLKTEKENKLNKEKRNQDNIKFITEVQKQTDYQSLSSPDKKLAEDKTYKYINNIDGFRDTEAKYWTKHGTYTSDAGLTYSAVKPKYLESNYEQMTEDEIKTYNYYYAKFGKAKAYEYLDKISDILESRHTNKLATNNYEYGKKDPLGASIMSVPLKLASSVEQVKNIAEYVITGETSNNDYATMASSMLQGVLDKVDWKIGEWDAFDFVYNTAMSGVDSLIAASMGTVGAVTLGLSAAADTTNDILSRGGTNSQAFWGGVAAGVFEGFFEKYSIGKLLDTAKSASSGFKAFAKEVASSMLTNLEEEAATEIANILYDTAVNGGISNYAQMVEEYMADGDDEKTARNKALGQLGLQVAESAASGALMGFGFGAIGSYKSHKNAKSAGKVIIANGNQGAIVEAGLSLDKNTEAYKMAVEVSKTKTPSASQIGALAYNIMEATSNRKADVIKQAVTHRAQEMGTTMSESQAIGEYFVTTLNGENKLSQSVSGIAKNSFTKNIAAEIKDGTSHWVSQMNAQLESVEQTQQKVTQSFKLKNSQLQSNAKGKNNADPVGGTSSVMGDNTLPAGEGNGQSRTPVTTNDENVGSGKRIFQSGERHRVDKKEQDFITKICNALGVKVEFEHITRATMERLTGEKYDGELPDGYFDKDTGIIHLGFAGVNPIKFVFKHELTHFGEGTVAYGRFVSAVRKSKAFKNWLKQSTGLKKGDLKTLEDAYQKMISKNYSKDTNLEAEMFSDFVGKVLFSEDGSSLENLLSDLEVKDRNAIIQYLRDFFNYLKKKLAGHQDILFEISHLEDSFNRMLSEAVQSQAQKNTAENSGVKFSVGYTNANVNNELKMLINKVESGEFKANEKVIFGTVSDTIANKIKMLTGVDVSGFKIAIEARQVEHILKDHGVNGKTDRSMSNDLDIAKIEYALNNPDDIRNAGKTQAYTYMRDGRNRTAETVLYEKNIGEKSYYVVQAVADTKAKTLYIVTAFIGEKGYKKEASQLINANSPDVTPNSGSVQASNNSIPENESTVNNNSTQENSKNSKNVKFSFAKADDMSLVAQAERMESQGADREQIWNELGLIRDSGGVWIYEIDDSEMVFYPNGDIFVKDDPDYKEYLKLDKKKHWTEKDAERFAELDDKFLQKYEFGKPILKNYLKHDKLFAKYPQLKDTLIFFEDLKGKDYSGYYSPTENKIVLDKKHLKNNDNNFSLSMTLIHEIQHAIQHLDDRENGSNVEFWNARLLRGERLPINPKTGEEYTPEEAYWYTAGELEARETALRIDMTEEERQKTYTPELGWDNAISAKETVTAGNIKFSIPSDTDYMSAVESGDTDTAQRMVDGAAKANGYTERLYHQTGSDFTEFNTDNQRAGKYDWELPTGTFLKPTDNDIGLKGKKQMELYAKIEKPLTFENRQSAQRFWSDNVPGYREAVKEIRDIDTEYRQKVDNAMADVRSYLKEWKRNHPDTDSREIYNDAEYQRLNDIEDSIVDEWEEKSNEASLKAKKLIDGFMQGSGFDGIVVTKDAGAQGRSTKTYIVFDSAQLKDASPVTYDDNGDIIPLSERFNENKKDIRFSIPRKAVDSYTEEQYNNFGWASYNDVITSAERETLLSRYADYKHNKDKYPTTRFGEAVIHSTECPDVIMYVKGRIRNPQITKIVRINAENSAEATLIQREILENEYHKEPFPYEIITNIFGEKVLDTYQKRNFVSFQEYRAEQEGKTGGKDDTDSGASSDRTIGIEQNKENDSAGLKESAFSMPNEMNVLLDRYESGEITRDEYQAQVDNFWDKTLAEMEDREMAQKIEAARYTKQLEKKIRRKNEQLRIRRSEVVREETERRQERADKQTNINVIRREIKRLDKKLRANTEKQHIPEEMKEVTAYFVKIFVDNDTSPFDKRDIRDIRTLYSDLLGDYNIATGEGELKIDAFDFNVLSDLRMLENRLAGKTLRELDLWETMVIRNIVENFAHIIDWENKMFVAGRQFETNQIGAEALKEIKENKPKRGNGVIDGIDGVKYSNMTPIYFFDRLGETFKKLFNDILHGQDTCVRNWEIAKTFITQLKEKHHYSQWENKTLKFTTEKGVDVELTVEQAMLLYATAKREYGNKKQRSEHLFRGGIVIETNSKALKDITNKFKSSDKKGRARLYEAFTEEVNSRAVKISPSDAGRVLEWLTKEQKDYADGLVGYLSNDMAALGNEVSMKLFGIRKFNEDYYIPYNSAQNYLYSQPGVTSEARLKHQSFTKETVVKANNPLMLTDFSTVCADHINRMCMYNALTIPLENMTKIFNFKTFGTENNDAVDMKAEIERVYGQGAVNYVKQFLNDVNGNLQVSLEDKFLNRWMSKFKKGAVFASASVVVQQPSAVMRAMAYINPKYFAKTTLKLRERDYQQACKYAPVAVLKEMGRFDAGVGMATTKWLLQEKPKGAKNVVKALIDLKDSSYRDDKLSYFAAKADEITWAHIWAATKAEIADTTDLKVGSEEFFEACGKRFTEVINYTQVYDSTISRSQIMRNKGWGAQTLTAFMAEPTVSLNLLMNAVREAKKGTKAGKKHAWSAVGAFIGNVILNALLKSLVTAGRDDDKEKTYGEKYLESFSDEMFSSLLLLNIIPWVKDIVSIFAGYSVERADMNLFSDLADAFNILDSEKKTPWEKVEKISGALAAFLGLPLKNILRDCRTAYNIVNDVAITDKNDRKANETIDGYMDKLEGNKTFESLDKEDREKLEKNISNKVRDVQTETQGRDDFAELYELLRKNKAKYDKARQKLIDEGKYTAKEITEGIEIARILYMKSIGIDVHEYLLYKIATNKKNADTDGSGGVTKNEKKAAVDSMDLDSNAKNYFKYKYK